MDRRELADFVRRRGLAVVATRAPDGSPEAALVGVTATDRGEIVFDTSRTSRKCRNLQHFPRVAVVVGWNDEVTVQCEGDAVVLSGAERERCLRAYLARFPDGAGRAADPDIVHVSVRPVWVRRSDFRPWGAGVEETSWDWDR